MANDLSHVPCSEGKHCTNNQSKVVSGSLDKLTFSNFISPSKIRKYNCIAKFCPDLCIYVISISIEFDFNVCDHLLIHSILPTSSFFYVYDSMHIHILFSNQYTVVEKFYF